MAKEHQVEIHSTRHWEMEWPEDRIRYGIFDCQSEDIAKDTERIE